MSTEKTIRPYTDLASELFHAAQRGHADALHKTGNPLHDSGFDYSEHRFGRIVREKLVLATEEAAAALGKTVGTYYTIHTGDIRLLGEEDYASCRNALCATILDAAKQLCPDFRLPADPCVSAVSDENAADQTAPLQTTVDDAGAEAWDRLAVSPEWDQGSHLRPVPPADLCGDAAANKIHAEGEPFLTDDTDRTAVTDIPPTPASVLTPFRPMTVLAVGLGNPALTSDALGPMCTSQLIVTRHLAENAPANRITGCRMHRLCAVTPLVLGKTGIETLELVRGAVHTAKPDLVILIDALAASELGSLTQTVQISTTGIHPGSGVGNKRQRLDRDTLGVPVMTVGIPTVIAASTLIYRALEAADILPQENSPVPARDAVLHSALAAADVGHVTPKDIDSTAASFASLIAYAVNRLVLGSAMASSLGGTDRYFPLNRF